MLKWSMPGVQGKPFRVILLSVMILTLLATSSLSADIKTLHKQAIAGDKEAQFYLGNAYSAGHGVPQDYEEALKWYRKAAEQGVSEAQYNLGVMYSRGRGVPRDYAESMKWYRKAAEQGNAGAMHNLGVMYGLGQGVPEDRVQSYFWLSLSVSRSAAEDEKRRSEVRDFAAIKLGN